MAAPVAGPSEGLWPACGHGRFVGGRLRRQLRDRSGGAGFNRDGFGSNLTLSPQSEAPPLPNQIDGTTVTVRDAAGISRPAQLYYVSAGQLSYVMPSGTIYGPATVTVMGSNNSVSSGTVTVAQVAPGLFSFDATGKGLAAYTHADGTQTVTSAQNPIDLSNRSDQVFLVLYGTGIRSRTSLATVGVQLGGLTLPALYADSQSQYPGLDQINVQLPFSLAGSGNVIIGVTVDGIRANALSVAIR